VRLMETRYQCSVEDYLEAQRAAFARTARVIGITGVLLIPVAVWEIYSLGLANTAPAILLGFLFLMCPFIFFASRVRRDFRRHPNLALEYRLRADDSGIELASDTNQGGGKWSSYTAFRETATLFVIYSGTRMFFMVPKRAFSEDQLDNFRRLVRQKLPPK